MNGSANGARVLLKARPTPAQLKDRLSPRLPEGLELYLDVADIDGEGWLERLAAALVVHPVPDDFAWVVEGPLRSLDGGYFDVARDAEADREVLRRLVAAAERIGAPAVVIHCMALAGSHGDLTEANRSVTLKRAAAFLAGYVDLCRAHGLVPTIENVPPVARMREGAYTYPLIGMATRDLVYLVDRLPGLRVTCDTSHAQLFLNAAATDPAGLSPELAAVARHAAASGAQRSLGDYVDALGERIYEAHISNAAGMLDEGLPYDEGDADLDDAVARLLRVAHFLVTEPIEPEPERADRMRAVADRIIAVRERLGGGGMKR